MYLLQIEQLQLQEASATGTWLYTLPSAGYYGGPASVGTFNINLGNNDPFRKITKAWKVTEQTATTLKLENKEPLENEQLVFSKK